MKSPCDSSITQPAGRSISTGFSSTPSRRKSSTLGAGRVLAALRQRQQSDRRGDAVGLVERGAAGRRRSPATGRSRRPGAGRRRATGTGSSAAGASTYDGQIEGCGADRLEAGRRGAGAGDADAAAVLADAADGGGEVEHPPAPDAGRCRRPRCRRRRATRTAVGPARSWPAASRRPARRRTNAGSGCRSRTRRSRCRARSPPGRRSWPSAPGEGSAPPARVRRRPRARGARRPVTAERRSTATT